MIISEQSSTLKISDAALLSLSAPGEIRQASAMTSADLTDLDSRLRGLFDGRTALVLEDEPELATHLADVLRQHGFVRVDVVASREHAQIHADKTAYDVLLLDRQVQDGDGLAALDHIRRGAGPSAQTPALFLTALGTERQKIEGLAVGGDDYVVKPVSDVELLARLAALMRRSAWEAPSQSAHIENGPMTIDGAALTATLFGERLDLTPREHGILKVLGESAGYPVTRTMLWSRCWSDYNFMPPNAANTIDVHVSRLRKKLDAAAGDLDPALRPLIIAVRSQGLMLRDLSGHS